MSRVLKTVTVSLGALVLSSAVVFAQATPPPSSGNGQTSTSSHSTRKNRSKKSGHRKGGKKKGSKKPAQQQ